MYCIHKRDARDGLADTAELPAMRRPSMGIISGRHGSLVVANGIYAGGTLNTLPPPVGNGKCHDNAGYVSDTEHNGNNVLMPNAAISMMVNQETSPEAAPHLEQCKL